ncbi:MAG: OmpA/MotB family protein [Candidatus Marinamargulisbacteria bacterium]
MPRHKPLEPPVMDDTNTEFSAVFSDLMSFLAGLFILLFTIVNTQKNAPQYFEEMSVKFGGDGVRVDQDTMGESPLVHNMQTYISDNQLSQYIVFVVEEQKIRLIFNDPILFESGTNKLTLSSEAVLNGFLNILMRVKNSIIVEGHMNHESRSAGANKDAVMLLWDMAYFRAAAVANYLIDNGLSPSRVSIASFGGQQPLSKSENAVARNKNQRIEIAIIRSKKEI